MYQISRDGLEPIVVGTFKAIMPAIGSIKPGQYVIYEITAGLQSSRDTVVHWGIGIKWADGSVEIECAPWSASDGWT
jgi:hypothetical protein